MSQSQSPPPPPPPSIPFSSREIQVVFGGVYIARTTSPLLVWEQPNKPPCWYLPESALLLGTGGGGGAGGLGEQGEEGEGITTTTTTSKIEVRRLSTLSAGGDGAEEVGGETKKKKEKDPEGEEYELSVGGGGRGRKKRTVFTIWRGGGTVDGYVRFERGDMDAWFDSGALTRLAPKNPSRRIDTGLTSAHVVVSIGGTIVAEAHNAVVLFETGLPPRYYLPATSVVDWRLLSDSDTVTACPYKGEARYFSVEVGERSWKDVIWYYLYPVAESAAVAGRLAFLVGRAGVSVVVDGVELEA